MGILNTKLRGTRPRSNLGIKKGTLFGFEGIIRDPNPKQGEQGPTAGPSYCRIEKDSDAPKEGAAHSGFRV